SAHSAASTSSGVVTNATASTDETGATAIQGFSFASNTGALQSLGTSPDAFGFAGVTLAPGSGVLESVVSNNSAINADLGAPSPRANVAAMGDEHVISLAGTTGPQTITSTDTFTLNGSSLGGTLVAGLVGGSGSFSAGTDSLSFTASVNGVVVEQDS